jgi:hypothetical protein
MTAEGIHLGAFWSGVVVTLAVEFVIFIIWGAVAAARKTPPA